MLFVVPTAASSVPARFDMGMIRELASVNATRFQWKIVGSCSPLHAAYAAASYQLTPATG
jgi:TPP-dependent 2-oxoacid decarboxylase